MLRRDRGTVILEIAYRERVCPGLCSYLRCAFYWLRAGLLAESVLVVVGNCCARKYRTAADRGDDHGNDRNGDCALVRVYVRVHRERHPAPFDPPRRLVIRGPYRFVRNSMYIGAGMTLAGAALFYGEQENRYGRLDINKATW